MSLINNKRGQGETVIKVLVIAIIAIIAIALAKSYFQQASRKTQQTVEDIFEPDEKSVRSSAGPTSLSTNPFSIK
jgi:F0F1-type ATP synthase membrane subunit a